MAKFATARNKNSVRDAVGGTEKLFAGAGVSARVYHDAMQRTCIRVVAVERKFYGNSFLAASS